MKTHVSLSGESFLINGIPVYSEIAGSNPLTHGLLMNARFIQGIFDDAADRLRYQRWGRQFSPEANTDNLIAALPSWYRYGLRAFTVGLQGGGPCFTIPNKDIDNNPYSEDGKSIESSRLARLARLLNAADEQGMVVIVSALYAGQVRRMGGSSVILNALRTLSRWLREGGWTNVIIEVSNEYNCVDHALVKTPESVVGLIDLVRRESGMLVGCSGGGGTMHPEIAAASDVILIHGNGQMRQNLASLIQRVRKWAPGKPVLCNEDSQALSNLQVCVDNQVSWGYYNNLTKQEPPADWGICDGEDRFFALRMAECLGLPHETLPLAERYVLCGTRAVECWNGRCWPRLAALYPETINYVDFFLDGEKIFRCYDDPHTVNYRSNWLQEPLFAVTGHLRAEAVLTTGETIIREAMLGA